MSEEIQNKTPINLENLSFGDVINAKRNSDNRKLEEMPLGHRIGPYVVIGHKNGNIIGFYATSVTPKTDILEEYTISIPEDSKRFAKKTYIDLHRVITILNRDIVGYRCSLTLEEKNTLNKKIEQLKRKGVYALRFINPKILPIEKGDIISFENNLYIIINICKRTYEALALKKEPDESHTSKITINNIIYFCNINDIVNINKRNNFTRIDCIDSKIKLEQLETLIRNYQSAQAAQKELNTPKKGSVVCLKDLLFYIFSEDEFTYSTYRLHETYNAKYLPVTVNGKTFYIDLSVIIKISKNILKNKAIAHSTAEEKKNIQLPKNTIPILGFTEYINKFKKGDIIANNYQDGIEYIVISSFLDVIIAIKKEEMYTNDFHPIEISPDNYHKISSVDKSSLKELLSKIKDRVKCNINSEEIYKLKKLR